MMMTTTRHISSFHQFFFCQSQTENKNFLILFMIFNKSHCEIFEIKNLKITYQSINIAGQFELLIFR